MDWSSAPENQETFTLAERDRRWARVRELMGEQDVDLLLVLPQWMVEDALYLANQIGIVIFPREGDPTLVIGGEGSNRTLQRASWIDERASATARGSTRVPYGEAAARRLEQMNLKGKRVAVAGLRGSDIVLVRQPEGYVNYSSLMRVREAIPDAEIVDGTPILGPARHVKSEEELDVMRHAVRIAEAAGRALAEHARPGVRQAEVFAQMMYEMIRMGAGDIMLSWCGGGWGEHKWRYTTPPPGEMAERWYVGCEIGPSFRGYNCQTEDILVVGEPDPQALEIWNLNLEIWDFLAKALVPGVTWGDVGAQLREKARGSGYGFEFLIHGRGLGNEGPMLIPVDTHSHVRDREIVENSTFILKPYAYPDVPDFPHVTRSHDMTWGDTVVIRPHGAERLGTRPHAYLQV